MTTEAQQPEDEQAQVVLRNVAEIAQRQQQRELGASLALQLFRLLKVVQFHAIDNMAVLQQLDQTIESLRAFGAQTGEPLIMMFARGTVFVAGQLFKASRGEYENALELGEMVRKLGVSEICIQTDATRADLTALARTFQPGANPLIDKEGVIEPSPRVRLRHVNPARLGEGEEDLSPEDQILRTYATSVVVMRRVHENLLAGRYELPHQAKRLAQRLVMLSEGDAPAFLGITAMRTLNHDLAGRAVNRAILAVAMARQLTEDLGALARIAMSALFLDVAHPLVTGIVGRQNDVVVAHMTEDAEARLPAATGLVLTALGQLRQASMVRTVIAYETHWLNQLDTLGSLYGGVRKAMVAGRIVLTAHRFDKALQPDLAAARTPSVDEVVEQMRADARDATERAMIALLIGALGIFPRGTAVELSTGEKGIVVRTPSDPAFYMRPTVRLVYDAHGQQLRSNVAIDLSQDDERQVTSVIAQPDELMAEVVRRVLESVRASRPTPAIADQGPPSDSSPDLMGSGSAPEQAPLSGDSNAIPTVPPQAHAVAPPFAEPVAPEYEEAEPAPEYEEAEPAPEYEEAEPAPEYEAAEPIAPAIAEAEPEPEHDEPEPIAPRYAAPVTPPGAATDDEDVPLDEDIESSAVEVGPEAAPAPEASAPARPAPAPVARPVAPPAPGPVRRDSSPSMPSQMTSPSMPSAPSMPSMPSHPSRAPPAVGPPRKESASFAATGTPGSSSPRQSKAPPSMGPPRGAAAGRGQSARAKPPTQKRLPPGVAPVKHPTEEVVAPDVNEISEVEPSAPSSHWRRAPTRIPSTEQGGSGASALDQIAAPSASGSFERTPFSHILLYLLDRSLTGTLIFTEPADRTEDLPVEHAAYFENGAPTKLHTGTRIAPLGSMLVAFGVLDQSQLEGDPITQPPIHEATLESELIEFGLTTAEAIAPVRDEQLMERLSYLFGLPAGTKYSFYNGLDLLEAIWGNVPGMVAPLAVLARGLREHPEESAMDRVLTRVAGAPLHLHPESDLDAFALEPDERSVADFIAANNASLPDLIEQGFDPDVIRRVVFLLMTTRCAAPEFEKATAAPSGPKGRSAPGGTSPRRDSGGKRR